MLIASRHGLSLLDLAELDRALEARPVQIAFVELDPASGALAPLADDLARFGQLFVHMRHDPEAEVTLGQSKVLENLGALLASPAVRGVDHILFVKDAWEVSYVGLPALGRSIESLGSGTRFDIYSTRTTTMARGFLDALITGSGKGQYVESAEFKRITIRQGETVGNRLAAHAEGLRVAARRPQAEKAGREIYLSGPAVRDELGQVVANADIKPLREVLCAQRHGGDGERADRAPDPSTRTGPTSDAGIGGSTLQAADAEVRPDSCCGLPATDPATDPAAATPIPPSKDQDHE